MIRLNSEQPVKLLELWEYEFFEPRELHGYLASELQFPSYYGENLAALSDCLGDISEPWAIIITRDVPARQKPWFGGFCEVFERAVSENPFLELHYDKPGELRVVGSDDETTTRFRRIERKLDAILFALQDGNDVEADEDTPGPDPEPVKVVTESCRNMASGADGDRFECGTCGCRVSDYLEDTRLIFDGFKYCPNCGREVANPEGNRSLGWVGELI